MFTENVYDILQTKQQVCLFHCSSLYRATLLLFSLFFPPFSTFLIESLLYLNGESGAGAQRVMTPLETGEKEIASEALHFRN